MTPPWRRVAAAADSEPAVDMNQPNTHRQKLSAQAPVFVPMAVKMQQVHPAALPSPTHRFPWRRQFSGESTASTTLEDDVPAAWSKQSSTMSAASTAATSTCSNADVSNTDVSSTSSEPEDSNHDLASVRSEGAPKKVGSLKVSANSWMAGMKSRRNGKSGSEEGPSHEEIVRKMKSILNKLTIEKFPTLSRQLAACGIQNPAQLEALVKEVLEKAITQHHFIGMYADLCSVLQAHFADPATSKDPGMNFKKILLTACQTSFEKRMAKPENLKDLEGDTKDLAEQEFKLRMLGNIKFVGAILVRRILGAKVMFAIIQELLSDSSPEALESLAALLTVVGPSFDQSESPHHKMLVAIFDKVEALSKDTHVKHRVRCLLTDVLDLRASGWQDRKPKKLEGPSTLEEVAQKFQAESAPPAPPSPSKSSSKVEHDQGTPHVFVKKPALAAILSSDRMFNESMNKELSQTSTQSSTERTPSDRLQTTKPESPKSETPKGSTPSSSAPTDSTSADGKSLEERLEEFIGASDIDEECADDLRARSRDVQEIVIARGSVNSARNPSALLRVRINQALRELNKTAKTKLQVAERARAARKSCAQTSSKNEAAKSKETREEKVVHEQYNKAACHKELAAAYSELMVSHDLQEAVSCISMVAVPPSAQPEELCELLAFVVDQGSEASRMLGFKLIVKLFGDRCWKPSSLDEGLRKFAKMGDDLKLDVPTLPSILRVEMVSAFQPLIDSGVLSSKQLQAVASAV